MPRSLRVTVSTEAWEALNEAASRFHSTPETIASRILNPVAELIGTAYTLVDEAHSSIDVVTRWGISHGPSEADEFSMETDSELPSETP